MSIKLFAEQIASEIDACLADAKVEQDAHNKTLTMLDSASQDQARFFQRLKAAEFERHRSALRGIKARSDKFSLLLEGPPEQPKQEEASNENTDLHDKPAAPEIVTITDGEPLPLDIGRARRSRAKRAA